MKRLKAFLLFFISFNLEVRVKAENIESANLLQKPDQCIVSSSQEECFFSSVQGRNRIKIKNLEINLFESSLSKKMNEDISFLNGQVGLFSEKKYEIQTPYGKVLAEKGARLWLDINDEKMTLTSLNGKAFVILGSQKVELPQKFKITIWKTTGTKYPNYSVPAPVGVEEFLKIKLSFYDEKQSKKDFIQSLKEDREEIVELAEKSSLLYQKIAERHIASLQENERQLKRKELEEQQKRLQQKRLYMEKVFER